MKQTILFDKKPVLAGWGSVAGKKESEGPLGSYFDITTDDDTFSGKNWEQAECRLRQLISHYPNVLIRKRILGQ